MPPHQEFIRSLNALDREIPAGKVVLAILDDYAAHVTLEVRQWLAHHPCWTFHLAPTSCLWMNAVEGVFAKLSRRRLQRGGGSPLGNRTPRVLGIVRQRFPHIGSAK